MYYPLSSKQKKKATNTNTKAIFYNTQDENFKGIGVFEYQKIFFKTMGLKLEAGDSYNRFYYIPNQLMIDSAFETPREYQFRNACGNGLHAWKTLEAAKSWLRSTYSERGVIYTCLVQEIVACDSEKVRGRGIILLDPVYASDPDLEKQIAIMTAQKQPQIILDQIESLNEQEQQHKIELARIEADYEPKIQKLQELLNDMKNKRAQQIDPVKAELDNVKELREGVLPALKVIEGKKRYDQLQPMFQRYNQIVQETIDLLPKIFPAKDARFTPDPASSFLLFFKNLQLPLFMPSAFKPYVNSDRHYSDVLLYEYPHAPSKISELQYHRWKESRLDRFPIRFWTPERAIEILLLTIYTFTRELCALRGYLRRVAKTKIRKHQTALKEETWNTEYHEKKLDEYTQIVKITEKLTDISLNLAIFCQKQPELPVDQITKHFQAFYDYIMIEKRQLASYGNYRYRYEERITPQRFHRALFNWFGDENGSRNND